MIRLFRFLKPYNLQIAIVLLLAFGQSMGQLYLPNLMADIVDKGIYHVVNGRISSDIPYIWRTGGLMLLVAIAGTLAAVVGTFYSSRVATGFGKIIRGKIFSRVEAFSLHEFDKVSTASLITRTTNDTTQVQQVLVMLLGMMITAPMLMIGGIIMALGQDVALSWILVVILPLLLGLIVLIMSRAIPLFQAMQVKLDKLNLVLGEGLAGVRVIRAFDRTRSEEKRFDIANADLTQTAITVNRIVAFMFPVMMLIMNGATVAIIWFGSIRISNGDLQPGGMIAFLQYAIQIMFALLMFSMMFIMVPRAAASATRINEVLDIEPEINDAPVTIKAEGIRGYVEFQDVTFSYPGAEEPALNNISFKASPGQVTAIIGGTGSGKSTLVNLIPRFYDIDSGHLLVDGVDIRKMSQEHLRSKIGFVPQKAVLFSGSINENIRFGKNDANREEIGTRQK